MGLADGDYLMILPPSPKKMRIQKDGRNSRLKSRKSLIPNTNHLRLDMHLHFSIFYKNWFLVNAAALKIIGVILYYVHTAMKVLHSLQFVFVRVPPLFPYTIFFSLSLSLCVLHSISRGLSLREVSFKICAKYLSWFEKNAERPSYFILQNSKWRSTSLGCKRDFISGRFHQRSVDRATGRGPKQHSWSEEEEAMGNHCPGRDHQSHALPAILG